jgi:hypothetical protein
MIREHEVIETLEHLAERHREIAQPDQTDDVTFTVIVYLYLKEKGYDVKRFSRELLELENELRYDAGRPGELGTC